MLFNHSHAAAGDSSFYSERAEDDDEEVDEKNLEHIQNTAAETAAKSRNNKKFETQTKGPFIAIESSNIVSEGGRDQLVEQTTSTSRYAEYPPEHPSNGYLS